MGLGAVPDMASAMRRLIALLFLAACASPGSRAPGRAEGAAPDGAALYRKRCASCHRLRDPSEQTAQGWAEAMRRMAPRAHLSDAQREAVLGYLQGRARDAPR